MKGGKTQTHYETRKEAKAMSKKKKKGKKQHAIEMILFATAVIQLTAAIITLATVIINLS